MRECFGCGFKDRELSKCFKCDVVEYCCAYYIVERNGGRCPAFGWGYDGKSEVCKVCVDLWVGKDCKKGVVEDVERVK
jgi:hypothetical protein